MASSRSFGGITPDMQSLLHTVALPIPTLPRIGPLPRIPANADVSDKKLFGMRVDKLREAIQSKQVSFPSQIPTFSKHTRPDLQRKLVQLYFVCGWSRLKIRARYGLSAQRFQQILSTWKNRAIELGFIQVIPPEDKSLLLSRHFPIRVTFSAAVDSPSATGHSSLAHNRLLYVAGNHINGKQQDVSARPRRKCDSRQIADLLKQLERGHSIAEIASEAGVTASTVRLWKRQHEMESLQRENRELKQRLASLLRNRKS